MSSFPTTGENGKIYVDTSTNKTYRWSGSAYTEISASLALGETSATAYRGDRGKIAYDHSQTTSGNPHNVTKSDVGLGNVGNFKAVSTVASQGLSSTEQANARANIGAGTSSFSGSYNDLSNKPTLGTAAGKDVASSGNASSTQVVMGNDSRLSDSRPASDVSSWAKASSKPTYTASEVGLGNVGNFKAVSTVASQGLSSTEQANARANIGAGTSSFSGSYTDLSNKPTLGTAAAKDVASSGNASTSQVVMGNDTRLSDARPASDVSSWAKASTKPTYTASEVGLGNVGNFKAVSTVANQGLTDTEKSNARTNIGAGTSSLVLGTGSGNAYRGDYGNTAYTHSQLTSGNPHGVTKSDVGLGNVGNFKAVSTVASQGLTATEQSNARANIGAGTSSFSGSYNDLSNKPTLGTAAAKDVASSGNASNTQVVMGNDTRLSDSRNAKDVYSWAKASKKPSYTASEVGAIATTAKGTASGVAELDANGKVPSSQLPSFVDDVLEYNGTSSFPTTGETGKIYVDTSTNKTYRWGGSSYVEISPSLALGETSSTAYRGDRGKTAYNHSQTTSGNPHNVTKTDVGLGNVGNFKAVSTVANQGLTATEQSNARTNIGAGTSSFSGSYNDLSNKPTIPTLSDATNSTSSTVAASSKAVKTAYDLAASKTSNTGTVTSVATGAGLTGGTITGSGTIKAKLKSETASTLDSTAMGSTANRQYAVGVDKSGYLSVNVPWTDSNTNTTYTLSQDSSDGHKITLTPSSGTATTITIPDNNTDTKNTAGSTDTSSKIFLIGATSQAANPQTYSDNEVYATNGVLTTKSTQVGGGAATIQYNATTKSIDFVFA